jgi:uncharacterized membrane protein YesL
LPLSSFEIACDQLQNSKTYIKWYWKLYRLIVDLSKAIFLLFIILLVMITFGLVALYTFESAFQYVLLFVVVFLVLTAIMNHLVEYYGD